MTNPAMGLVFGSAIGPESLAPGARMAEELGFDEVWLSEDYFFTGGVAGAASALSATTDLTVGIGVVSAVARHPALLAMELATLERQHPGRLRPGIGLGVPAWLDQMGLRPESSLGAVRECVTAVRALLAGERLDRPDGTFTFDGVQLTYPLETPPAISMGVSGPRMLRLSGEVADATLLSVTAGADYVRWARERIDEGRAAAGRDEPHRVTVFALFSVDEDGDRARAATRSQLAFYRGRRRGQRAHRRVRDLRPGTRHGGPQWAGGPRARDARAVGPGPHHRRDAAGVRRPDLGSWRMRGRTLSPCSPRPQIAPWTWPGWPGCRPCRWFAGVTSWGDSRARQECGDAVESFMQLRLRRRVGQAQVPCTSGPECLPRHQRDAGLLQQGPGQARCCSTPGR